MYNQLLVLRIKQKIGPLLIPKESFSSSCLNLVIVQQKKRESILLQTWISAASATTLDTIVYYILDSYQSTAAIGIPETCNDTNVKKCNNFRWT